jgi:protein-disulfide isomerase
MHTSKTIQYPHRTTPPKRPRLLQRTKLVYGAAIGIAAVGAAALVLASVLGSNGSAKQPAAQTRLPSSTFAGIAQRGAVLGAPAAPVTLVEYADLQCPFCGAWAREQLPTVVDELVQAGRLRIQLHGLTFVGPDSATALAGALAAARQGRLWEFVDFMYANQGTENSGWVASRIDDAVAAAGIDRARWDTDRSSTGILDEIDRLSTEAADAGISSTPSFAIGRTGGHLRLLDTHALDAGALRAMVDRLAAE